MLQTLPTACQRWSCVLAAAFLSEEDQKTIRGIVFPTTDVALVQGRGQLGFDIKVEEFAVQRPTDHPRRVQSVMAQGSDEGLSVPVAEGGVIHQTRSVWCPPGRLGHVGLEGSLVDG